MHSHWPLLLKAAFKRTHGHVVLRCVPPGMPVNRVSDQYRGFANTYWDAFHRVVAWPHQDSLHPCVPHILAFSQHLSLMLSEDFPFALLGLVHLRNRIVQHRPIDARELLRVSTRFGECVKHSKGWLFTLRSQVMVGDECVWQSESENLFRVRFDTGSGADRTQTEDILQGEAHHLSLTADLGRRYAAVSGDYNLIHIHPLLARVFGFRRAIAHGMWSKARCLSGALGKRNQSFCCDTRFYKPIFLPGEVKLVSELIDGGRLQQLQSPGGDNIHLHARVDYQG